MTSMRQRIAVLAASTLALGGATVGIMASGASADTTSSSTTSSGLDAVTSDQGGAQVQVGDQTSVDSPSATDATTEAESTAPDGVGGHQDPAGNVDNQSTTEF